MRHSPFLCVSPCTTSPLRSLYSLPAIISHLFSQSLLIITSSLSILIVPLLICTSCTPSVNLPLKIKDWHLMKTNSMFSNSVKGFVTLVMFVNIFQSVCQIEPLIGQAQHWQESVFFPLPSPYTERCCCFKARDSRFYPRYHFSIIFLCFKVQW